MENPVLLMVLSAGLIFGTVTDIRKREVPDWVNYGLIFSGVGINIILSIVYEDISFIAFSLIGLGFFYLIALLMFYTAQWGGGDSKMLMGIGALLGLELGWPLSDTFRHWAADPFHNLPMVFYFLVFTMFIGSLYGTVWSIVVSMRNLKEFRSEFSKRLHDKNTAKIKLGVMVIVAIMIILALVSQDMVVRYSLLSMGFMIAVTFYLFVYIKSVESVCMQRYVKPSELTEGDWIVEDVKVGNRTIASPKDLGVSREQIEELVLMHKNKKISRVLIKEGIPFVPSFLLSFVALLAYTLYF
ncbi:prepilin peptidase [Candidatus Woesearchaeota archaeon]|nr:prepilin peptidase [Candidatus Woesearchaeota archaeon]